MLQLWRRRKTLDLVARFLDAKSAKRLAKKTLDSYGYSLNRFAACSSRLPLTPEMVESFLRAQGPTDETIETYYRVLHNFYGWLKSRQITSRNPMIDVERPVLRKKVAASLTREELTLLLTHPSHHSAVRAMLFLLADTGIRIAEALSLQPAEGEALVKVVGKTGERFVPIRMGVKSMVLTALPWPWTRPDSASAAVRKAFIRAGLNGRGAGAHMIRRTFARAWNGDELVLQGILGHSSLRTSLIYRPYNLERAVHQHAVNSPARAALQMQLPTD